MHNMYIYIRTKSRRERVSHVQKYKSLRLLLLQEPAKSVHWTHFTWLKKKEGEEKKSALLAGYLQLTDKLTETASPGDYK